MKKIMNVVEVEGEGLLSLIGEQVILYCENYFYAGTLSGVNKDDVLLTDASIVYETGPHTDANWKDAQKLPNDHYVRVSHIESYGKGKKK